MSIFKQSDVFTVIIVASVGVVATFILCNMLLSDPNLASTTVKRIGEITTDIKSPDPEVFNKEAINPTVEVEVGVCEDTNGNGILDQDERDRCMGIVSTDTIDEEAVRNAKLLQESADINAESEEAELKIIEEGTAENVTTD